MLIIERYFAKQFVTAFLWTIAAFVFFYLLFDMLSRVSLIIDGEVPAGKLTEYYLSMAPLVFVQVCPVAVLLATMFTLSNMSRHNELIAAVSCGKHPYAVFMVFLLFGLVISTAALAVHEKAVPRAAERTHAIRSSSMGGQAQETWKNRIVYGSGNRRFFIKHLNASESTFSNFEITGFSRAGSEEMAFRAGSGAYSRGAWLFDNVMLRFFDGGGSEYFSLYAESAEAGRDGWHFFSGMYAVRGKERVEFEEFPLDMDPITETPEDFTVYRHRYDEMNFRQLRDYIERLLAAGFYPRREIIALHSKIALPLASIVLMMIGISFSVKQKKGGFMLGLGAALGFTVLYYIIMSTGSLLGEAIIPPAAGAWLANAVFLLPGAYFTLKAKRL